jgi:uncharacterized membrane protein YccF (DUF307 family)
MHCNHCHAPNDPSARNCRECGAPLASTAQPYVTTNAPMTGAACPACRRRNPLGANYCVFCATPLAQPVAPFARPAMPQPAAQPSYPPGGHHFVQPAMQPAAVSITNTVHIGAAQPAPYYRTQSGTTLLVRVVWFFFVGWWLGFLWTLLAWGFNLTLIGLPVGLMMLNATPKVTTLRAQSRQRYYPHQPAPYEQPFLLRTIWFVLIGWWASLLWVLLAYGLSVTILLMPIAFWMYDRVPTITTLAAER